MRIAWLTDIHLDFLDDAQIAALGARVAREAPDGVLITGDISVASALGPQLAKLVAPWRWPCWFVCGNHDYYGASIAAVRQALRRVGELDPRLVWLPAAGVVRLDAQTALVGVDGWADGRLGDPEGTPVVLNDHLRIAELVQPTRAALLEVVRALGDAEARALETLLGEALAPCDRVLVATHVPPFREASTHEGRVSDDAWLPWMTCHAVGETLRAMAASHPSRRIDVFCGHTHDRCHVRVTDNLTVRTGAAEYGAPAIEDVIVV